MSFWTLRGANRAREWHRAVAPGREVCEITHGLALSRPRRGVRIPRLGLERASPWVISPTSLPGATARCHSRARFAPRSVQKLIPKSVTSLPRRPDFGREEVGPGDLAPVSPQKGAPGRRAARRRLDPVVLQHLGESFSRQGGRDSSYTMQKAPDHPHAVLVRRPRLTGASRSSMNQGRLRIARRSATYESMG